MREDDLRQSLHRCQRLSRSLAARLADGAELCAQHLEQAAVLHDRMAGTPSHPLADISTDRARRQRHVASRERQAARTFRHIAAGGGPWPLS